MLTSFTVRRFTPPTCTLEIKAKTSPLSRWTDRPVFKNLHFRLSFDDPKIPKEEQITIQGDRLQLEQLYDAVIDYVQNFLHQSFTSNTIVKKLSTTATKPYLQSQGLVNHQLWLGSLANSNSTKKIVLSSVQLFDLATALEEYQAQIVALPKLDTTKSRKLLPIWGSVAAMVILAIGMTPAIVKLSRQPETDSIASSSKSEPLETIPELKDVVPPKVPQSNRIQPKPQLKQPLSSTEKLPPPPAVDVLKPQPDIPDPANYPLPEVAARSKVNPVSPNATSSDPDNSQQVESTITIPPKTQANEPKSRIVTIAPPENELNQRSSIVKSDDRESIQPQSEPVLSSRPNPDLPLTQAIRYFEDKWQPPDELKQSLEYRLLVDVNGTIKKVVPIGKASAIYLDRTNIPLQEQAFIAPLPEQERIIIRLLLNPDGEVAAFLE